MNVRDATPPGDALGSMAYNFAVVGVQKGGTSTLAVTLNQHQLLCQAPDKERHYFDDETVDWSAPDHERDYTAPRRARVHRLLATELDLVGPDDEPALRRSHDELTRALDELLRARPGTDERISRGQTVRHLLLAHLDLTAAMARRDGRLPVRR